MIIDAGRREVDDLLGKMERKVAKEYKQAAKEVEKKLGDYLDKFHERDMKKLQQRNDGKITQTEYQNWRVGQMAIGNRWRTLRDDLAQDYANANRIAESIVDGYMPEVYALSHNYATYEVETGANIDTSYTLYDRQTVERLMRDNPQMLPKPGKQMSQAIREGKVKRWNQKQVQSVMMQSLLQGEAIPKIAKRLANKVAVRDTKSAVRYARTMTTGAENAGRQDGYKRAVDMGVKMKQGWVAVLDAETRDTHRQLDGQQQEVGKPFYVDGMKIMYPGDPTAPGKLVWNCRCCLVAVVAGSNQDVTDLSNRNTDKMGGMSYDEWKNAKRKGAGNSDAPNQQVIPKQEAVKPLTLSDAKTFEDARRYFETEYGIKVNPSIDDLDFKHCKHAMHGIDDTIKDFPELKGHIKQLSTRNSGYMCSDATDIYFNPSYFDKGEWYDKDQAYQAGSHEAGHCIDMLICLKEYRGSYWGAKSAWNSCEEAKGIIRKAVSNTKKRIPEYAAISSAQMRQGMSNYSLTDTSESLAEGVGYDTLYRHRGVDRTIRAHGLELAKEIVKVLKERLL